MCGIVGITSSKEVTSRIIGSLKKLEYRGYDSAGIATIFENNINRLGFFVFLCRNVYLVISYNPDIGYFYRKWRDQCEFFDKRRNPRIAK